MSDYHDPICMPLQIPKNHMAYLKTEGNSVEWDLFLDIERQIMSGDDMSSDLELERGEEDENMDEHPAINPMARVSQKFSQ